MERRHPDNFARRKPETYTPEEFLRCVALLMEILDKDLPEENYQRALKKMNELCQMTRKDIEALQAAPFQMPDLEKQWADVPADDSPLVQHPSSAENPTALPTLAVNPATPYTSESPV